MPCEVAYALVMGPTIASRTGVASAAGMLFVATLVIVVDIRIGTIDIVPDVIGGVLVLLAVQRLRASISGADGTLTVLMALAVVALPITVIETLAPTSGALAYLGLTPLIGTVVLADLLARALRQGEPGIAARWRTTFHLVIWLGVVPYLAVTALGAFGETVTVESPLAVVLVAVLAAPLIQLLVTLSRTRTLPAPGA